ncbi:hypothetical protein NP188_24870, partial [Salmonella enterica]|nr:hypothetical protein [Salmonella enterica]
FAKERGTLQEGRRQADEQLAACGLAREQQQLQQQQTVEELGRLRSLCLALDGDSFEAQALQLWRDSVIPRTLDSYPYHTMLGGELAAVRRTCDQLPGIMSTKLQELARSLRAAIERVSRENAELQRQLQEAQRQLKAAGEAQAAARKEADAALAKAGAECAGRVQQAQEVARVLRGDRDVLAAQLDARTQDVARLGTQLDARGNALDACLRARSPPLPPVVRPPVVQQPPPLDPAALEDFKKRVLESQRFLNAAAPPSG